MDCLAWDRGFNRAGFTLIDLMIVVVMLGILAALVMAKYGEFREPAVLASLQTNLRTMRDLVRYHREIEGGEWPKRIEPQWFPAGRLPDHPEDPFDVPVLQVVERPPVLHPGDKVLDHGVLGAYWYNSGNGRVLARVAARATHAETLAFYHEVNGTSAGKGDPARLGDPESLEAQPIPAK